VHVERRDLHAVGAACWLLVVGVAGAVAATVLFVHRHHEDVAAVFRNPSYRYGLQVVDNQRLNSATSVRIGCEDYIAAHPATFPGFSPSTAVHGCVYEWNAVND
jgi:hypothetical protein